MGKFGYQGPKKNKVEIKGVETSQNRKASKDSKIKGFTLNTVNDFLKRSWVEIFTCANTMCLGSMFKLHKPTGKVVNVIGFHDLLETIKYIKVLTAITFIYLKGEKISEVFNKTLSFGDLMEHTLVLPIQIWKQGITVNPVPK